jgi:hypothetical protein
VTSVNFEGAGVPAADILAALQARGVRVWLEEAELRYRAPQGALTTEDIGVLRSNKQAIAAFLREGTMLEGPRSLTRGASIRSAPLTFSQLAHCNLYQLGARPAMRQVATALQLHGHMDLGALRASFHEVVRRHDALRTRIKLEGTTPTQVVEAPGDFELQVTDLSHHARCKLETLSSIEALIVQPIDVAKGPLLGAELIRQSDTQHVLVLAMEHTVSDMYSLTLLSKELLTAYSQAIQRRPIALPNVDVQLAEYAMWLHRTLTIRHRRNERWWKANLLNAARVRFPETGTSDSPRAGWGSVEVDVGSALKEEILTWYAATVLRWCDVSDAVFPYQIDGRTHPELSNTIGFLSSPIYLRMQISKKSTFLDLLGIAIDQYCAAYEHPDFCYFEAQQPRPGFTVNTSFNWIPTGTSSWVKQGAGTSLPDLDGNPRALRGVSLPFEHPLLRSLDRDAEPFVLFYDTPNEIVGRVHFPLRCFRQETMEKFARNFRSFLISLVRRPHTPIASVTLD